MKRLIELSGPTGVGKTTLFRRLEPSIRTRGYLSLDEAVTRVLRRSADPSLRFPAAAQFLLDRRLARAAASSARPVDKYPELDFAYRRLLNSFMLNHHLPDSTIVDDDPVSHLFMQELLQLADAAPQGLRSALPKRAFVFLKRAPDTILANRLARLRTGVSRWGFSGTEDREPVLEDIERALAAFGKLADTLDSAGYPVLVLDLDACGPDTLLRDLDRFFDLLEGPEARR